MERPLMAKLTYACVLTRQIDRLASFYQEVLQTTPKRDGPYVEFSTGPGIFCLWTLDAYAEIAGSDGMPQPGAGAIMLEFEVDDVDAEFARLRKASGPAIEFIIPPTTMPWGNRSIYVRDPDGNLLNLFSRVQRRSGQSSQLDALSARYSVSARSVADLMARRRAGAHDEELINLLRQPDWGSLSQEQAIQLVAELPR
jgi:catechol 2,3-dioxygenase-like lactoylglutathione lyase family enzyme